MPHARQQHLEEAVGVGIDVAHADDAVAALHEASTARADRGHAAGEAARGLRALEPGELVLEDAPWSDCRRANRSDWPVRPAKVARHLVIGCEGEQRGLEDRRHDRPLGKSRIVREDGGGLRPVRFFVHVAASAPVRRGEAPAGSRYSPGVRQPQGAATGSATPALSSCRYAGRAVALRDLLFLVAEVGRLLGRIGEPTE